jgi:pilus assembly protein CpaB
MRKIGSGGGLLLLAVVLGVATAVVALTALPSGEGGGNEADVDAAVREALQTQPGVVAREDIPAGTTLTEDLVAVAEVPAAALVPGTAGSLDVVVGRVTRYPLVAGEQVGQHRLVVEGEQAGNGLAFAVPPGMRAMSVSISEVRGAGGNIVPGDRVDVMVHTQYERMFSPSDLQTTVVEDDEQEHPVVITVLQDVLVLAVGQTSTTPNDSDRDTATLRSEEAEAQPAAESVTLAVTAAQAQTLVLAELEGTVSLALRPFGDSGATSLEPVLRLEPIQEAQLGVTAGN